MYAQESYTVEERSVLDRHFTNTDLPVFAVINLPEIVKGALFARYSRSHKSLRRLFLDEFYRQPENGIEVIAGYLERNGHDRNSNAIRHAENLYDRIFFEYGDDSVAQLGGAHLACEQASAILAKIIERGRIAAYLEQSTRYIYYDEKLRDANNGVRFRYRIPPEIESGPLLSRYTSAMDRLFERYSMVVHSLTLHHRNRLRQRSSRERPGEFRRTTRGLACDAARGLLPAATTSNIGVFATGQAYETMLMRMNADPLAEAREYSNWILPELRKVISGFLTRVDLENRGVAWSEYFRKTAGEMKSISNELPDQKMLFETPDSEVRLIGWDHDAEAKVIAAALFPYTHQSEEQLFAYVVRMSPEERERILSAYVGERKNRRHKPGRGMERVYYHFEVISDYGSFRDLQRHRMMTIDWQKLTSRHGYLTPPEIEDAGSEVFKIWHIAMQDTAELYEEVLDRHGQDVAQYVVPFGYRIRYNIQLNARQAFHMLELRTDTSGHANYRRVCAKMHQLIRNQAGHTAIADAMTHVNTGVYSVGRLAAERRQSERLQLGFELL